MRYLNLNRDIEAATANPCCGCRHYNTRYGECELRKHLHEDAKECGNTFEQYIEEELEITEQDIDACETTLRFFDEPDEYVDRWHEM